MPLKQKDARPDRLSEIKQILHEATISHRDLIYSELWVNNLWELDDVSSFKVWIVTYTAYEYQTVLGWMAAEDSRHALFNLGYAFAATWSDNALRAIKGLSPERIRDIVSKLSNPNQPTQEEIKQLKRDNVIPVSFGREEGEILEPVDRCDERIVETGWEDESSQDSNSMRRVEIVSAPKKKSAKTSYSVQEYKDLEAAVADYRTKNQHLEEELGRVKAELASSEMMRAHIEAELFDKWEAASPEEQSAQKVPKLQTQLLELQKQFNILERKYKWQEDLIKGMEDKDFVERMLAIKPRTEADLLAIELEQEKMLVDKLDAKIKMLEGELKELKK